MVEAEQQSSIWTVYTSVRDESTLQQGDLIRFVRPDESERLGIVITADCDLDKRKHSRMVTLVPLLSVEDLICTCLALDFFETQKDALRTFCKKSLKIEDPITSVAFVAQVKARLATEKMTGLVEAAAKATAHVRQDINLPLLAALARAINMSWDSVLTRFKSQIDSRGDIMRVTRPPLVGSNSSVIWIRSMWQEPVSEIALKTSDASALPGVRVAQLASPYRYRLTQMLGQVFSDIGLPPIAVDAHDKLFQGMKDAV